MELTEGSAQGGQPRKSLSVRRLLIGVAVLAVVGATALTTLPGGRRLLAAGLASAPSQRGLWTDVSPQSLGSQAAARRVAPNRARYVALDRSLLDGLLARAPREFTADAVTTEIQLELPWPDGAMRRFRIEESPIMEPGLAAQFPELKTYRGQGIDDPTASVRFDWTPTGFHAMVLSADGTVYVDPYAAGNVTDYVSYFRRDYQRAAGSPWSCGLTAEEAAKYTGGARRDLYQPAHGTQLRTYRVAMAATGEYTAFYGGTVNGALAGIVTTMNRVNGIYERDLAVHMNLVANTDQVIFTDAGSDPYTNSSTTAMLNENQTTLTTMIGTANFDIGHVFSTSSGGIAGLGVVCAAGSKGRGVTGSAAPIGDAFDVDFVAHEMGHQFGGNHTFNGTTGNCGGGNRNAGTAYEPGSGSTIQAYSGICGAEDLQVNSDAYFHAASQSEMISFITNGATGGSCAAVTSTGNTPPTVSAGPSFTIPQSTPFTLTASGSDINGDALTYTWEEYDLGTASPPNTDDGTRPIFRSFTPTSSPSRTFPKLSSIINNTPIFGESLPTTTRSMTFRVTARDNRANGGGTASSDTIVNVRADSGAFVVTQPNTAISWAAGSLQSVTWNVANTSSAPVSAANVKISLSTDGGLTYPTVLAASTPNDGSELVAIPGPATTTARIKVEAVGNIFFDISNANFSITAVIVADTHAITAESLTPNNAVDPGETVTVNLGLRNTSGGNTSNLVATLQAGGGVLEPSGPANYGVLVGGGATVLRPFTFRASPALTCGATLVATLQLQDGAVNYGGAPFTIPLGAMTAVLSQNFDGVTAPTLPAGWGATLGSGPEPQWVTSASGPDSAPNAAFVDNAEVPSDKRLDSPAFNVTTSSAQLTFRNSYDTEAEFDGGVLEISLNGGAFVDILAAGGSFVSNGYNETIVTFDVNPLAGRQAWSGSSGGYVTTVVNLPAAVAGQSVRLRWRMGSDSVIGAPGWRIDGVVVTDRVCAAGAGNYVQNGTFANGTTNWTPFSPTPGGIVWNTNGGVFQFFRQTGATEAEVIQSSGLTFGALAPIEATFDLGNSDNVRRRVKVLLHDLDFSDSLSCTFFLDANAPLRTFTMRTHSTKAWTNATISVYASTAGSNGGFYQLDNVLVRSVPGGNVDRTQCLDPLVPAPPGGVPGPTLLTNGDFNTGSLSPWTTDGPVVQQVTGGVLEFLRGPGAPAPVVLQSTGQAMLNDQILTATFQLGNSSSVRKRVKVLIHDLDFSDAPSCIFWIPPGQALLNYTMRVYATKPWATAAISFYPSSSGSDQWTLLDNVTLQRTPATAIAGTDCFEPGASPREAVAVDDPPAAAHDATVRGVVAAPEAAPDSSSVDPVADGASDWLPSSAGDFIVSPDATWIETGTGWEAVAATSDPAVLRRAELVDLRSATSATLTFQSWLSTLGSEGEVQVSVNGIDWITVSVVPASSTWVPIEVDLGDFLGEVIAVQFVFHGVAPPESADPDVWRLDGIDVNRDE